MFEAFENYNFRGKALANIEQANLIIAEYQRQGFTLTLRQLYYQFVARDLLANKQANYKSLGALLNKARLAGLVDWDALEDRTRNMQHPNAWTSPESILQAVARQYAEKVWDTQPRYVVVLEEKDALLGVIEPVCTELRVPYMSCRGHVSQSEMYSLGKRLKEMSDAGREPYVVHIGDHDPSGTHMTDDIIRRLSLFAGVDIEVNRIALNMDQIRLYRPPPNPAKESDSRFDHYVATYNTRQSWELDALSPTVLAELIREAVTGVLDQAAWDEALAAEARNKGTLEGVYGNFADVQRYLEFRTTEVEEHGFVTADEVLECAEASDHSDLGEDE
jgi:hypothetical protein